MGSDGTITPTVTIPRMAFIITTYCTLECSHCLHLSNRYKERTHFAAAELLQDIATLSDAVDAIGSIHVMGGEALAHPELAGIIRILLENEKIGRVGLTTNCTILPDTKLIQALRHPRAVVNLSNYPTVTNTGKWAELLTGNGISYHLPESGRDWVDAGGVEPRGRTVGELKSMYSACLYRECITLLNGKLFICPRNANACNQGLLSFTESRGINLRDAAADSARKRIAHMLNDTSFLACCDRCDFIMPGDGQRRICRLHDTLYRFSPNPS